MMANLRDPAARRRLDLSPITTSLAVAPQPQFSQTPSSALSSLSAPFGNAYNPSTYTPAPISAVRQYNPQQWTPSPSVPTASDNGSGHFANRPDPEVVAPAPPPYSPPRSQRPSTLANEEPATASSPAPRVNPATVYRSSPEPGSSHAFPPPPGRARAASNDRPRTLFGIAAFNRHHNSSEASRVTSESNLDHPPVPRLADHAPIPLNTGSSIAPQATEEQNQVFDSRPPASRRAVSAGAISTPSTSRSRGSSSTRWEPGMPLPPPPPGPPPQSRSQSMNRTTDRVIQSPPTRRPGQVSTLGPVPPTPAGWVDEDTSGRGRSPNRGLTIDTSSISSSTVADSNSGSSSSGLNRSAHVRGEPKSIRERRNESKARKNSKAPANRSAESDNSNNPWAESITPADIAVPSSGLTRRSTITKSTPRSARFAPGSAEPPKSAESSMHVTPGLSTGSRGSTPRPLNSSSRPEAPTPPFSPGMITNRKHESSPLIPPKALPTPPPQSKLSIGSPARPISHILHMPNNDSTTVAPLVPSRPGSRPASRQSNTGEMSSLSPADQFARAAIERHKAFAMKEAAASTDSERVRMFAEFIVTESRLRRDRYATAIDAMGSEILELTRDLFRPYNTPRRESNVSRSTSGWTPDSSTAPMSPIDGSSHRGSLSAALQDRPRLNTQLPPEPTSGSTGSSPAQGVRPESSWWTGYMPSLSPIPSMSVSEALDGSDSRGRPSSRWWEVSQEGSTGAPSTRLERSKRESKYMGMPRELREALQNGDPKALQSSQRMEAAGPSNQIAYGPDEYPPEKVGWPGDAVSSPQLQQVVARSPAFSPAGPITPNPQHLDVSRLVTLPPPYPRHHPAVNNNHPDLTSIRTQVRVISDLTEVHATKERFVKTSTQIASDNTAAASKRRNSLRASIQAQIASGSISYADAAKIEESAVQSEAEKTKEASKLDFELFQSQVVIPLNDLLMDRVSRASELFEQLRSKLFVDAQEQSPNYAQEEGDEQPELLEKLTLLKWIFEAREQLHRELFDLLSDRNDRYRDMVIIPYRLANNAEKIKHAEDFFSDDARKRKLTFEQEVLKRTEEFMDIIEQNVVRGVEVQLSAFWDIAPSLSRIAEKVPKGDLTGFQIQIPPAEYEENPSYYAFPMQYLYSLLSHCEKSTYQFIESQTNLLCLLHEVKSGVTVANCRLMKIQRVKQGEDEDEVERELKAVEKDEEVRLTDDLKEKVRCVEELWSSALGTELVGVKGRIAKFLIEQGGWDEDAANE